MHSFPYCGRPDRFQPNPQPFDARLRPSAIGFISRQAFGVGVSDVSVRLAWQESQLRSSGSVFGQLVNRELGQSSMPLHKQSVYMSATLGSPITVPSASTVTRTPINALSVPQPSGAQMVFGEGAGALFIDERVAC